LSPCTLNCGWALPVAAAGASICWTAATCHTTGAAFFRAAITTAIRAAATMTKMVIRFIE
jgi:hypothetical protein